jgi:hypothetical protein
MNNLSDDSSIDFSPLDPRNDPERFETLVRSISARASEVIKMRRLRRGVMAQIASWRAPTLAAAGLVVAISIFALVHTQGAAATSHNTQVAEAVGVPGSIAPLLRGNDLPTTSDLLEFFGGQQ